MLKKIINEVKNFPTLFWLTGLFTFVILVVGLFQGANFVETIESINKTTFSYFGDFYLWFVFAALFLIFAIAFSPLGKIRLGGQDSKPDHSFFSWFAMIFCAGMGVGILFWGSAEPLYHFMNPPLASAHTLAERQIDALHMSFFHWGLSPWAIYGLAALIVGFFALNLKRNFLFSEMIDMNGEQSTYKNVVKPVVDFITVVAIMFGVSASFAVAVLHLEGGLQNVFGFDESFILRFTIILVITIAFLMSSMRGLSKGIRVISNFSMGVCFVIMLGIFIWGPKYNLMEIAGTLPDFVARYPAMSTGLLEYNALDWLRKWTLPYWAWWIAWSPFVGIFIALISKGRTVRELVCAVLVGPTIFSVIWFVIFGNAALMMQINNNHFGSNINLDNVNTVLFTMLSGVTDSPILPWLCLILIAAFFINSADSATYTLASLSYEEPENENNKDINKDNQKQVEPPKSLQVGWGLMFTCLASLFLFTGGLQMLLKVTLVTVLPFSLWLIVVSFFLIKEMIRYYKRYILGEADEEVIKKRDIPKELGLE